MRLVLSDNISILHGIKKSSDMHALRDARRRVLAGTGGLKA